MISLRVSLARLLMLKPTAPSEHPKIDLEDGKPDADLFGAATLAKLSVAAAEEIIDEPESSSEEEEK